MSSKKGKPQPVGTGMVPSKTEVGSFIRARRIELDIRQVPLAKKAGLTQRFVSNIETGSRKYLDDRQLGQLAKALQCDTDGLRKRMPVKHVAQPTTELGKLIRSRREELGMNIGVFAKKLKMTPQRAKHLEIRKNPSIRYDFVEPLATVLDLDLSVLGKFAGTTRKETKSELGQLVRTRRKELAMSIEDLAQKLDVSRQFVNQIEFGQCRLSENDEMIAKLAQVLDLDVDKLEVLRPERRLKQIEHTSPLGGFLAAKRLELHLTQRQVAERAEIGTNVVSGLETGKLHHPSTNILDKLSKALDCEIPVELIPVPGKRVPRGPRTKQNDFTSSVVVHLSDQNLSDLERIKELSDIRVNTEAVRKALKILRLLLEKQNDKYVVCLRKDKDIVELEFLF